MDNLALDPKVSAEIMKNPDLIRFMFLLGISPDDPQLFFKLGMMMLMIERKKIIEAGDYEKLKALLDLDVDANDLCGLGTPMIHMAAIVGQEKCLTLLIERGANVNILDDKENSLSAAASHGQTKCASILIDNGADVNQTSGTDKSTPLLRAIENGHEECALFLIESGANINLCDSLSNTPLNMAVSCKLKRVLSKLIQMGVDVNYTDQCIGRHCYGQTALHIAASMNWHDGILLLVQNGADTEIRDNKQRRPIDVCNQSNKDITDLLIGGGTCTKSA